MLFAISDLCFRKYDVSLQRFLTASVYKEMWEDKLPGCVINSWGKIKMSSSALEVLCCGRYKLDWSNECRSDEWIRITMPPFKAIYIHLTILTVQWMLKASAFEMHVLWGCCRTSWTATGWFKGDWEQPDARLPVAIRPGRALCPKKYACQAGAQISCCWCTHVLVLRPRHQQQEFCAVLQVDMPIYSTTYVLVIHFPSISAPSRSFCSGRITLTHILAT